MMKSQLKLNIVIFALMIAIGGAVYSNSLQNSFHFDDLHYIVGNPYITTLKNVPLFFTDTRTLSRSPEFQFHYRPLLLTSYAVNYYFGRLRPAGYHLGNLLFHIGSAFLVFLIVRAMLQGDSGFFPALSAGLLFLEPPF